MHRPRAIGLLAVPLLVFLALPVLVLAERGLPIVGKAIAQPEVRAAIAVSLQTSVASLLLLVILGTPLAWWLSGRRGWIRTAAESLIELPLVLPPAAAGIGLLLAYGRHGWLPTSIAFTPAAVIAAQVFVAAPYYVRAATSAFGLLEADILASASAEGAGDVQVFRHVAVPIIMRPLLGGAAAAWARAVGEFGATILFAGSFVGRTQTMPLAIYLGFEGDLDSAVGLSVVLLLVAAAVLVVARIAGNRAMR